MARCGVVSGDHSDSDSECDLCGGGAGESVLVETALEHRSKGWALERSFSMFCGWYLTCEMCGRDLDEEPAVSAYETGVRPDGY